MYILCFLSLGDFFLFFFLSVCKHYICIEIRIET